MEYRNVGSHVEDLFGGATVGVGETVELDDEQVKEEHNERLVSEGTLVSTEGTEAEGGDNVQLLPAATKDKSKTQDRSSKSGTTADAEGGSKE